MHVIYRKRLLPAFIKRATEGLPAGWSVSVLQPVAKEADVAPAAKDVCAKCGKAGEKLLNCSRCKVQKYCSKECQVCCTTYAQVCCTRGGAWGTLSRHVAGGRLEAAQEALPCA